MAEWVGKSKERANAAELTLDEMIAARVKAQKEAASKDFGELLKKHKVRPFVVEIYKGGALVQQSIEFEPEPQQ